MENKFRVTAQTPKFHKYEEAYECVIELNPQNLMTSSNTVSNTMSITPPKFMNGVLAQLNGNPISSIDICRHSNRLIFYISIPVSIGADTLSLVKTMSVQFMEKAKKKVAKEIKYDSGEFELREGNRFCVKQFYKSVKIEMTEFWNDEINSIIFSFVLEIESVTQPLSNANNCKTSPNFDFELFQPLSKLRDSKSFCDVEIICGGKEFQAHKVVLSALSPVFKSMFESKLKEEQEGRIVIGEIESTTLQMLLDGIYSGKLDANNFPELVELINLFKAAHRYMICSLTEWAAGQIGSRVNMVNALEIFSLSLTYENEGMRIKALEMIKKEKKKIFHNPTVLFDFMKENLEHTKLIHELFTN